MNKTVHEGILCDAATLAHKAPNTLPTKVGLAEYITRVLSKTLDSLNTQEGLSANQSHKLAADLRSGMVPAIATAHKVFGKLSRSTPARDLFAWVASAASKKDLRSYIVNRVEVYPDDVRVAGPLAGMMAAIDGSRLHIAPAPQGLEPGPYDIKGARLDRERKGSLPNIRALIPPQISRAPYYEPAKPVSEYPLDKSKDFSMQAVEVGPSLFDRKFLQDALSNPSGLDHAEIQILGDNERLTVWYPDGSIAVVMPLRR